MSGTAAKATGAEPAQRRPAERRPAERRARKVLPPSDGLAGLPAVTPRPLFGRMPNAPWQNHGILAAADYKLAFVEFDDQGRAFGRMQIDALSAYLDELAATQTDAIIVAFVHGWKHDARSDDENLSAFRLLLVETARHERSVTQAGHQPRPVLGVFVAWRGLSYFSPYGLAENCTFGARQSAGGRVAVGAVREVFGRLRGYRNQRLTVRGAPVLVIAGHSFGGMIVFSALAQSLIEAASTPIGTQVPSFADLVLLVNPAIEGARFLPIYDLAQQIAQQGGRAPQLPVFVCAQAKNDFPVGKLFPWGNWSSPWLQVTRGRLERLAVNHAIGFIRAFHTHELTGPSGGLPFSLSPAAILNPNPFWIVEADKAVINNHSGIWQKPFLLFLASLVLQHVHGAGAPPTGSALAGGVPPSALPPGLTLASPRRFAALDLAHPAVSVWQRGGSLAEFAGEIAKTGFTAL